jgi:hypothetical protein
MEVAVGIKLVELLMANLPAIIDTAPKLLAWINRAFVSLSASWDKSKPSTPEEIDALIALVVKNHLAIQAIE